MDPGPLGPETAPAAAARVRVGVSGRKGASRPLDMPARVIFGPELMARAHAIMPTTQSSRCASPFEPPQKGQVVNGEKLSQKKARQKANRFCRGEAGTSAVISGVLPTAETLDVDVGGVRVPPFFERAVIERLEKYKRNGHVEKYAEEARQPDGSTHWVLTEHSYRLVISTFERPTEPAGGGGGNATYRFESQKVMLSGDAIRGAFGDPAATDAEIAVASVLFVLMTHVSYAAIEAGEHPSGIVADDRILQRHFQRDFKFSQDLLNGAASQSGPDDSLQLLAHSIKTFQVKDDPMFRDRAEECWLVASIDRLPPGVCQLCAKDVHCFRTGESSKSKVPKSLATIRERCQRGVWHIKHSDECSYVCANCGTAGHPRWECP